MKVICVNAKPGIATGTPPPFKEGEILTASDCRVCKDGESYEIAEYPTYNGWPVCYDKWRFAPLSEIDETTFSRNYQTENA